MANTTAQADGINLELINQLPVPTTVGCRPAMGCRATNRIPPGQRTIHYPLCKTAPAEVLRRQAEANW